MSTFQKSFAGQPHKWDPKTELPKWWKKSEPLCSWREVRRMLGGRRKDSITKQNWWKLHWQREGKLGCKLYEGGDGLNQGFTPNFLGICPTSFSQWNSTQPSLENSSPMMLWFMAISHLTQELFFQWDVHVLRFPPSNPAHFKVCTNFPNL